MGFLMEEQMDAPAWGLVGAAIGGALVKVIAALKDLWTAREEAQRKSQIVKAEESRKDKDYEAAAYKNQIDRQERALDRNAKVLEECRSAVSQMYAFLVRSVAETKKCHDAHDLTVAVLRDYHEVMTGAQMKVRPLPNFIVLEEPSTRDSEHAEFLMRSVEQIARDLFAADAKRKRDSDTVATKQKPTEKPSSNPELPNVQGAESPDCTNP